METDTSVNYRFWGPDSIAYGPVELPGLVAWIKQGKVRANTWVFREMDGTWSRASDLTELKILFKSKLPPSAAAAAAASGIQPGSLRRIKMLADVEERLLASLLTYLEVVKVPPFGTVVNKGEHGDALFMVLEGEVRARVMIDAKETTLATMGVGECFGELSIVDQGPRSADVIANQPTVLVKVSGCSLEEDVRGGAGAGRAFHVRVDPGARPQSSGAEQAVRRLNTLFPNRRSRRGDWRVGSDLSF